MRIHEAPEMGYYAEAPELGYYAEPPELGWYGAPPDAYGWYAEPPELGGYGEVPDAYGWYAEPPDLGYYAEPAEMGWYGEAPEPYGGYGEPPELGYYAEYPELGYGAYYEPPEFADYAEAPEMPGYGYGYGYGQMPEMVGYHEYEPLAEDYPGMAEAEYGEPDLAGYVRQGPPAYNPGCPLPTNVAGFGESAPLEGYVKPGTVNPTCEQFIQQPGGAAGVPDTFRPLW